MIKKYDVKLFYKAFLIFACLSIYPITNLIISFNFIHDG